ncbi:MAG: complex I NDUFA9 subunit family protein [Sterolibacterium sp.]|nr:complex I NDUFA9 subunit family protein [Sterolibacterium sp.]
MEPQRILLIGGTGFLGNHLARRLSGAGHWLCLPTRRRERAKHLLTLPTSMVIEANVHDPDQLATLINGQDIVINLVGILQGGKGQPYGKGFARAHFQLPYLIAAAAKAAGVRRVLHVSALKAAADAPSGYLRSKTAGEEALREAGLDLTIFRPSVIFGSGDQFLNVFAALLRRMPVMPLACPNALFQPVWVEDVCACIAASLSEAGSIGQTYELCGPRQYTLRQLVEYVGAVTGHRRPILGLSDTLSYLQAWAMEFVPNGPMTRDNYYSMQIPNVCANTCGLPFGLSATPLEAVAPTYLLGLSRKSRYNDFRRSSGR